MAIPIDQLGKTDLSLLVYYVVLVEEKTVARASTRLKLTQPAITRALQRLRDLFHDDLLIRSDGEYLPTPRGRELLTQLAGILPQLEDVIAGKPFDPATSETQFRITGADSLCHFYGPLLARKYRETPRISFLFSDYGEQRYADLETNARDLVLDAQYKSLGGGLRSEVLFEEGFICAVNKNSHHGNVLTLKDYLAAKHVTITTLHEIQGIPDLAFAREGLKRQAAFRVPYFAVGLAMVANTELVVTLPKTLAALLANSETTRLVQPPEELGGYSYIMAWHRRQEKDSRHIWLRERMRAATIELKDKVASRMSNAG